MTCRLAASQERERAACTEPPKAPINRADIDPTNRELPSLSVTAFKGLIGKILRDMVEGGCKNNTKRAKGEKGGKGEKGQKERKG
jgi:hypothetical protein